MINAVRRAARATLLLAAVLSVTGLATACTGQTGSPRQRPAVYEFSFQQDRLGVAAADQTVRIYAALDRQGRVERLYTITLGNGGSAVYESWWTAQAPSRLTARDWTRCTQSSKGPDEAIPRTLDAMETGVLGPAHPPSQAQWIAPKTWRLQLSAIHQGLGIMTVRQFGPTITDRVVTIGLPGHAQAGTIIQHAALSRIGRLPGRWPSWPSCHVARHRLRSGMRSAGLAQ